MEYPYYPGEDPYYPVEYPYYPMEDPYYPVEDPYYSWSPLSCFSGGSESAALCNRFRRSKIPSKNSAPSEPPSSR